MYVVRTFRSASLASLEACTTSAVDRYERGGVTTSIHRCNAPGAPVVVTSRRVPFGTVAGRLARVLEAVTADPGLRVSQVDVLEAAERDQLLAGWNDTAAELPSGLVPDLIAARAARVPDAVAVMCGAEQVSYAELQARAGRLAGFLSGLGVGSESVVGLCLPRGTEMVVSAKSTGRRPF